MTKGLLVGAGFGLGLVAVTVVAVTVGTVKTWTSGETLTSSDLNSTISSLKAALDAIPNWTKSGTSAVYTDGNVGIGTTSPTFKLTVGSGTIGNVHPQHDLVVTDSEGSARVGAYINNKGVSLMATGAGSGGVYAYDYGTGTGLPLLLNEYGGNVGIGTTSPTSPLHVVSAAYPAIELQETGRQTAKIEGFGESTGSGLRLYTHNGTSLTERLRVNKDGNVGIGQNSPAYPLHMASGAYVSTGGVWTNASSREYKENMRDLTTEEAVAAVMALEPQKFSYKSEKGECAVAKNRKPSPPPSPFQGEGVPSPRRGEGKGEESPCTPEQYVGFVAEDVPDLVATKDRKGLSAMDLVAVLTKVVQTQQAEIEDLQRRISSLKIQ